ncbi:glycoside hydrolase family 16 protein [Mongoliibacter ruber]|uniref:Glycosyl hydrolase family 16 n=1 Tax=Mongoliibacter ruber TaxID=1750599 RepID=A0A2T0WMI6_9BACT|nr:glycoside hydrolase family 16 protein [Mongoliibacter ruber]PRY87916.1 glycosyl hydrolase family 16 [Mongoliibacter ruber]
MGKIKILALFLLTAWLSHSCSQEEVDQKVLLPSNLTVEVDQTESGLVSVTFQADNVNFFKVGFGVGSEVPQRVAGNQASYTYRESGEFQITVQAHTTEEDFISEVVNVTIAETVAGGLIPDEGYVSPEEYSGYRLVWQDEFEGSSLSSDWVHELGDGCPNLCGWGNNESQFYRRENTTVTDGYLIIEAKEERVGGKEYTSSRIKTQDMQSFTYGRIDVRALLPKGQGIWPAIWMLGDNITEVSWPACGEIDIMELIGGSQSGRDDTVHGTVHWDNNGTYANFGGSKTLSDGIFNDKFYVFSIIWDAEKIIWLLDNVPYHEIDIRPQGLDEFRRPFFFLLNVAVGGNWPGYPNASTSFPQRMVVDYVRVFQAD